MYFYETDTILNPLTYDRIPRRNLYAPISLPSAAVYSIIIAARAALNITLDLAVCLRLSGAVTLIVELFTAAETYGHLNVRTRKVQVERNERIALLRCQSEQLIYLTAMQQQLSVAERVMIEYISLLIRAYMHAVNKKLSPANRAEGVLEIHMSRAYALYLGSDKGDTRLAGVLDKIVVTRLSIVGDKLTAVLFFGHRTPPLMLLLMYILSHSRRIVK